MLNLTISPPSCPSRKRASASVRDMKTCERACLNPPSALPLDPILNSRGWTNSLQVEQVNV